MYEAFSYLCMWPRRRPSDLAKRVLEFLLEIEYDVVDLLVAYLRAPHTVVYKALSS